MNEMLCRAWWMPALRGAVAIVFGLTALFWPGLTLIGLMVLFAAYAILGGVTAVIAGMRHRRSHDDWWMPLLLGIAAITAGAIALVHPGLSVMVLVLLIGAHALISGVLDIAMAIRLRKTLQHEWLLALAGVAAIVFGIVVFLFPGAGALAIVWMISVHALVYGILLLSLAVRLRRVARGKQRIFHERRVQPDRRMAHAR
ncbi:MAG TPA: HdeD family acid-resistance protein [Noviherbaspirillum sp.]